ncbi:MAG: DUF4131 domain-containing protein, partial [Xanthomonadaceae bacterium]|nr:DUF4131 domain-containing protein [Xanthomonadaceae bacterium]
MSARTERRAIHNGPGMLAGALAVLAGAVLVQGLPVLPPRWLDAVLAVFALAGLFACLRWREFAWLWLLPLVVGAFAWTAFRADLAMQARLPHALEKQDILVTGVVTDLPQVQEDSTRFEFDIAHAEFDGRSVPVQGHVRLSWYASRRQEVPAIQPCSTWRLRVRMKRPHGLVNPGGLDFERSALQKGI